MTENPGESKRQKIRGWCDSTVFTLARHRRAPFSPLTMSEALAGSPPSAYDRSRGGSFSVRKSPLGSSRIVEALMRAGSEEQDCGKSGTDRGSDESVSTLADRYGRLVFTTAHRILANTHDAEDVLQQVFLKLFRTWGNRVKPEAINDWGAYLRTMATRTALDMLRAQRQRRWREMPLDEDDPPNELISSGVPDVEEKMDRLRQALAELPERDAQVFTLRYFEEFPYEAIAAQMGISLDLVGVILHRARKRLRETCEPSDAQPRADTLC
jgi:RNA polymerase sigma-70 factor, ECF subfamily